MVFQPDDHQRNMLVQVVAQLLILGEIHAVLLVNLPEALGNALVNAHPLLVRQRNLIVYPLNPKVHGVIDHLVVRDHKVVGLLQRFGQPLGRGVLHRVPVFRLEGLVGLDEVVKPVPGQGDKHMDHQIGQGGVRQHDGKFPADQPQNDADSLHLLAV